MTQTTDRPTDRPTARSAARPGGRARAAGTRPPRRPAGSGRPSVLGPGALAAAWALGAGLVALAIPVLLAWAADGRSGSGAGEATRSAGQLWLLAHGASLTVPGGSVGLTPLGLTLVPLALLHRAGRHAATTHRPDGLRTGLALTTAIAFPYATGAAFLAALCSTEQILPGAGTSLLGAFVVALVGAGAGICRETRLHLLARRLPEQVRTATIAAAGAVAVLLACGALLVGASLALHASRASSLAGVTDPGLVGGVALLLLGIVLVPNAVLWGSAFVAGPGIAVGTGTAVGPLGVHLGSVPALPLFAALPSGDVPFVVSLLALTAPVVAGVVAGLLTVRRGTAGTVRDAATQAALAGPAAGLGMLVLAWLSGGPLGGGRLADVGPCPWQVGLAVLLEVGLVAAATAALAVRRKG